MNTTSLDSSVPLKGLFVQAGGGKGEMGVRWALRRSITGNLKKHKSHTKKAHNNILHFLLCRLIQISHKIKSVDEKDMSTCKPYEHTKAKT